MHHQETFLLEVLFFEKTIELLHITRSMQDRADQLAGELDGVNDRLRLISQLSNLALQLYSWYIRHGVARNEKDEAAVQEFFEKNMPGDLSQCLGFYEKLYQYQSFVWYAFIRQDFLMYYRYTQKWVDLFEKEPFMLAAETSQYIKGMHNLLGAHFDLLNDQKFRETLKLFEEFSNSDLVKNNVNNRIQTFVYLYISKLNQHFIDGTFTEGLSLVPYIEEKLSEYWI